MLILRSCFIVTCMFGNVSAMVSTGINKLLISDLALSQNFIFCFIFFVHKAKSKRFGGLGLKF